MFFFLLSIASTAQTNQRVLLSGVVQNAEGEVLPGASVVVPTQRIGVATDREGKFELRAFADDLTLKVSYIGFEPVLLDVSREEMERKEFRLDFDIVLRASVKELEIAEITGEARTSVFQDKREAVLDFAFLEDELLLLIRSGRAYRLERLDLELQTIGTMLLSDKPTDLFEDCLGNVHVLYKEKADQLARVGNQLQVAASSSMEDFKAILMPCVASTAEKLILCKRDFQELRFTYYWVDRKSGDAQVFYQVEEDPRRKLRGGIAEEVAILQEMLANETFATESDRLAIERDIAQYKWFESFMVRQSAYHPLFKELEGWVVFDHFLGEAVRFDAEGALLQRLPLEYPSDKNWSGKLHGYEEDGSVYIEYAPSGISELYAFDLDSGEAQPVLRIRDHLFPEKLKIKDDRVWYIHQGISNTAPGLYVLDLPMAP